MTLPKLGDLNILVMKLLHASPQLGWSGVSQQASFVVDVSINVSNLKLTTVLGTLFGSECWATIRDNEQRLAVIQMKLLCWTSGITSHDHIRNKVTLDGYELLRVLSNCERAVSTCNSRWGELTSKIDLYIEVDGKRLKDWKKQRWPNTLDGDLKASWFHPDQAFDRGKWLNRSQVEQLSSS